MSTSRQAALECLYQIMCEPALAGDCWEHEENCCAEWCSECAAGRDSGAPRQDRHNRMKQALAAVSQAPPEPDWRRAIRKAMKIIEADGGRKDRAVMEAIVSLAADPAVQAALKDQS